MRLPGHLAAVLRHDFFVPLVSRSRYRYYSHDLVLRLRRPSGALPCLRSAFDACCATAPGMTFVSQPQRPHWPVREIRSPTSPGDEGRGRVLPPRGGGEARAANWWFCARVCARAPFLGLESWASGGLIPVTSRREAWTRLSLGASAFPATFPGHGKQRRGVRKEAPAVTLPLSEKRNTHTRLSFCATANIATFLAGRGSYFVYV